MLERRWRLERAVRERDYRELTQLAKDSVATGDNRRRVPNR